MKLKTKKIATVAAVLLTVGLAWSCKHDAGVLDKCLGKNITIDTLKIQLDSLFVGTVDTTVTPVALGDLDIDSTYIHADIRRAPYLGSIDAGKTWYLLPHNFPNLAVGTYHLVAKDADSCVSPVFPLSITY